MSERIFLRFGDRLALGADSLQWILYKSRAKAWAPSLGQKHWTPISYVSSTKEILLRCIRESGLGEATAASALESLPSTFEAWKAATTTPTPLPPLNFSQAGNKWPRKAPSAARRMGTPCVKWATINTATVPFKRSRRRVSAAKSLRPVRRTLVAPILPEPIAWRSAVPARASK